MSNPTVTAPVRHTFKATAVLVRSPHVDLTLFMNMNGEGVCTVAELVCSTRVGSVLPVYLSYQLKDDRGQGTCWRDYLPTTDTAGTRMSGFLSARLVTKRIYRFKPKCMLNNLNLMRCICEDLKWNDLIKQEGQPSFKYFSKFKHCH